METIIIALIVAISSLGGVYLGFTLKQRSEPKNIEKQEIMTQQENSLAGLFDLEDAADKRAFRDLQKALSYNGKVNDDEADNE